MPYTEIRAPEGPQIEYPEGVIWEDDWYKCQWGLVSDDPLPGVKSLHLKVEGVGCVKTEITREDIQMFGYSRRFRPIIRCLDLMKQEFFKKMSPEQWALKYGIYKK